MTTDSRIRLTFRPSRGSETDIALSDFLKQAEAVQTALQQVLKPDDSLEVCIVDVTMNSPITLVLEPRRNGLPDARATGEFVSATMDAFTGVARARTGRKFFDALHDFQSVIGKGIASTTIEAGEQKLVVDLTAQAQFEKISRADLISTGVVDGMLESVNLHNQRNTCNLFPEVGPARITCKFTGELFDNKVRPALGRYVQVYGELKYRWREALPYEVVVADIKVLDDGEFPSFSDILGMAPDATGGKLSENFVRELRDAWR